MAHWVEEIRHLPGTLKDQKSFGMDSSADVANLPPLSDKVSAGSDAFSVAEKQLFMLGSDGVWR